MVWGCPLQAQLSYLALTFLAISLPQNTESRGNALKREICLSQFLGSRDKLLGTDLQNGQHLKIDWTTCFLPIALVLFSFNLSLQVFKWSLVCSRGRQERILYL